MTTNTDRLVILACGSRNWTDHQTVLDTLTSIAEASPNTSITLVHGDCRGADRMAGQAANSLGWDVHVFPADWNKHGKRAGFIRNAEMIAYIQKPGAPKRRMVIAFSKNIRTSRGTANTVERANDAGLTVRIVDGNAEMLRDGQQAPDLPYTVRCASRPSATNGTWDRLLPHSFATKAEAALERDLFLIGCATDRVFGFVRLDCAFGTPATFTS